jgi:neutral amino acid transport system ATP-binding protein
MSTPSTPSTPYTASTSGPNTGPNTGSHAAFSKVQIDAFEGVGQTPGAAKADSILVAEDVRRRFGGLTAVAVEHLEIQRGAITALIGPNGAGKTTFFNLLTGFDRPNSGRWNFDGDELTGLGAHHMKLGGTQQTGENFFRALVRPFWRDEESELEQRADELLERFNLTHMRGEFAGELSGGQRKLLEMARALMAQPRLIMLDEPMAGVNPALAQTIIRHVQDLRDDGLTVVFVEHDMDVVREISDWVVVMSEGEIVAEGRHSSIVANPAVIDAYLGAHHATPLTREEQDRQLAEAEAAIEAEERARTEEGA